ncbi:MAG: GGDEF domain-containing protein [Acidobacteria bacterium]|nr:GGDEF domain-containing protein [Acidobacteriota bacterium]
MAIAATPIPRTSDLLDLLRQIVPPQERAVELYRRLLAINELSGSMNSARNIDGLQRLLAGYFNECLPGDSIRLCIVDGAKYRNVHLSGPEVTFGEPPASLNQGIAGSVLKSKSPMWIPDMHASRRIRKFPGNGERSYARSIMVLPVSAMKRVVGCLEMLSSYPNRFDEIEYHLGSLVAAHLSSALDNILTRQELANANARLRDHDLRLTQLNEKLQQLAHTDEATGLFNKRRLFERLDMEIARAKRYGEILSCLMIDIDDFKQINDIYGHQAGDQILKQIGALLRRSLRITDFIARYGGEEFTILLPRTNSAGAYRVAENLRSTFMSHDFALPTATIHLTISIGVACCSTFNHLNAQQIIFLADSALYRAKRSGKNQACFADETEGKTESQDFVKSMSQV